MLIRLSERLADFVHGSCILLQVGRCVTFVIAHAVKVELGDRTKGMPVRKVIEPCHVPDLLSAMCLLDDNRQVCAGMHCPGA